MRLDNYIKACLFLLSAPRSVIAAINSAGSVLHPNTENQQVLFSKTKGAYEDNKAWSLLIDTQDFVSSHLLGPGGYQADDGQLAGLLRQQAVALNAESPSLVRDIHIWPSRTRRQHIEIWVVDARQQQQISATLLTDLAETLNAWFEFDGGTVWDWSGTIGLADSNGYVYSSLFYINAQTTDVASADDWDTQRIGPVDDITLNFILQVKLAIMDYTTSDDLLLFLGNTASYLYNSFLSDDDRITALLPGSSPYYESSPSQKYADWIPAFNILGESLYKQDFLTPAFQAKPSSGRVILIDNVSTGSTFDKFNAILQREGLWPPAGGRADRTNPVYLISLYYNPSDVYYLQGEVVDIRPQFIRLLDIYDRIAGPTISGLNSIDHALPGRLLPYYPAFYWSENPDDCPLPDIATKQATIDAIQAAARGPLPARMPEVEVLQVGNPRPPLPEMPYMVVSPSNQHESWYSAGMDEELKAAEPYVYPSAEDSDEA